MKLRTLLFFCALFLAAAPLIAFPDLAGWKPTGEVQTYGPGTLHEYINGAADVFLAFGFERLEVAELEAEDTIIAVSLYDMGSPLNAFGIYRTELPPDSPTVAIGSEAHLAPPYQCLLLKDRIYAKVDVYEGELDEASARAVVTAIAAAIPGRSSMPAELRSLSAPGLVKGSESYTKKSYLGLRELDNCVWAKLTGEGDRQVFRVLPEEGQSLDQLWQKLAAKWQPLEGAAGPALTTKVPYRGQVGVIRAGEAILGMAGSPDREALVKELSKLGK